MNLLTSILLIGIILSLFYFKNTQSNFLKWILIGLILSVVVPFLSVPILTTFGYFVFGILSLIYTFYCFKLKKHLGMIIGLFVFISFLVSILNLPLLNEVRLMMIVPVLCFAFTFKSPIKYQNELSILIIFAFYQLGELLQLLFIN